MAHPNGRMSLTALRITEQMAIFEAKVFLDRSDAEPFSMSTAQQTTQDSRDFVKAAQNEALSQALISTPCTPGGSIWISALSGAINSLSSLMQCGMGRSIFWIW